MPYATCINCAAGCQKRGDSYQLCAKCRKRTSKTFVDHCKRLYAEEKAALHEDRLFNDALLALRIERDYSNENIDIVCNRLKITGTTRDDLKKRFTYTSVDAFYKDHPEYTDKEP